jgi:hypothetical protein
MLDVKSGQIWKVRSLEEGGWCEVRVVSVVVDSVELEYVDICEVTNLYKTFNKTFTASRYAMLMTASDFQFVARGIDESLRRKQSQQARRAAGRRFRETSRGRQ